MSSDYYLTKESVEEYIKLADGVNGKEIINKLKPYILDNCSVLEIGTGPGKDWEILSKNFQVTGSDFSNEFLTKLIENNPNGKFLELNAITLDTSLNFDCIYSNKVLHHLTNEELASSIIRQYSLLNENGKVCHTFWKGQDTEIFKGMYVNYHEKSDLVKAFSTHFEIMELEYYNEFEDNDSIILIGRKK